MADQPAHFTMLCSCRVSHSRQSARDTSAGMKRQRRQRVRKRCGICWSSSSQHPTTRKGLPLRSGSRCFESMRKHTCALESTKVRTMYAAGDTSLSASSLWPCVHEQGLAHWLLRNQAVLGAPRPPHLQQQLDALADALPAEAASGAPTHRRLLRLRFCCCQAEYHWRYLRYVLFACRLLGVRGTGNGPGVGGFCGESIMQPLCYAAVDQFSHQQR